MKSTQLTKDEIFKLAQGKFKGDYSIEQYIFSNDTTSPFFKSAKNEKTGDECKFELSYILTPPNIYETTEDFLFITVELRIGKKYFIAQYQAINEPKLLMDEIERDAEQTFEEWCAAIGAIPPKVEPAEVAKKDIPPPANYNPEDDEIQY